MVSVEDLELLSSFHRGLAIKRKICNDSFKKLLSSFHRGLTGARREGYVWRGFVAVLFS